MRVSVTNLTLNQLSTDIGLIPVGSTTTVSGVSPEIAYKVSLSLKLLVDAGKVTVSIADDTDRLDLLEPASFGADTSTQSVVVTIPSASVLTLNATPVTLVAAPGSGKALIFEGATMYLAYNSAAYAGIAVGEDIAIKYTGSAGLQVAGCETTGFLDQTSSQLRYVYGFRAAAAATVSDVTPVANAPLVAHMLLGEVTTGNSPLYVKVFYRVIAATLP